MLRCASLLLFTLCDSIKLIPRVPVCRGSIKSNQVTQNILGGLNEVLLC